MSLSHGVKARSCQAMVRLQEILSLFLAVQGNCPTCLCAILFSALLNLGPNTI